MKVTGTVIEIGDLEGFDYPTPGLRLDVGDERIVEVIGLSRDEIKSLPNLMFKRVTVSLEPAT